MKVDTIRQEHFHGEFCRNGCPHRVLVEHKDVPSEVMRLAQPGILVNLNELRPLYEATYKEIAMFIDGNFLNQNVRANELKGIRLAGFDGDTMIFDVNRAEYDENGIVYKCLVKFDEWEQVGQDADLKANEKARMILWVGNLRLHCTDPSFLFWGYQQILSQLDAAIFPEERYPGERNPTQRGVVCKHLNRVLRVLPFHSGDIAAEFKRQFGG